MITAVDYSGNSLSAARENNQREPARGFTTFPWWPATSLRQGAPLEISRSCRSCCGAQKLRYRRSIGQRIRRLCVELWTVAQPTAQVRQSRPLHAFALIV